MKNKTGSILNRSSLLLGPSTTSSFNAQSTLLHNLSLTSVQNSHTLTSDKVNIDLIDWAYKRRSRIPNTEQSALQFDHIKELLDLTFYQTLDPKKERRPYPAAGGIYTVQLYLLAYQVEDLAQGVYFLNYNNRELEKLNHLNINDMLSFRKSSLQQSQKELIPLLFLFFIDTRYSTIKYQDRAWRLGLIEAGALVQTLYLGAEKLQLSACALGAISDRRAMNICGLTDSVSSSASSSFSSTGLGHGLASDSDYLSFACGMSLSMNRLIKA